MHRYVASFLAILTMALGFPALATAQSPKPPVAPSPSRQPRTPAGTDQAGNRPEFFATLTTKAGLTTELRGLVFGAHQESPQSPPPGYEWMPGTIPPSNFHETPLECLPVLYKGIATAVPFADIDRIERISLHHDLYPEYRITLVGGAKHTALTDWVPFTWVGLDARGRTVRVNGPEVLEVRFDHARDVHPARRDLASIFSGSRWDLTFRGSVRTRAGNTFEVESLRPVASFESYLYGWKEFDEVVGTWYTPEGHRDREVTWKLKDLMSIEVTGFRKNGGALYRVTLQNGRRFESVPHLTNTEFGFVAKPFGPAHAGLETIRSDGGRGDLDLVAVFFK